MQLHSEQQQSLLPVLKISIAHDKQRNPIFTGRGRPKLSLKT